MKNQNSDSPTGPEFVLDGEVGCHPIGEILPKMTAAEEAELHADIEQNGLRDPLMIFEGLILDGRHRNAACLKSGVPRRAKNFLGSWEAAVDYVKSMNLMRRHLTTSQRAWAAGKLANLSRGRPDLNRSNERFTSQAQAAETFNVPEASVKRAVKIQTSGIPELKEKVQSGEISLGKGAVIASASPLKQKQIISKGRKASDKMMKKLKVKALKSSDDGIRGCLHCDPNAVFDLANISRNMQKISVRAADFAKKNKTENFASCFEGVAFEAEEIQLSNLKLSNSDKILAVIDSGTEEGEKGIVWEGDILRITKMPRVEFDDAIGYLTEYGMVKISYQQGKTDVGRGGKKKLFSRADPKVKDIPDPKEEPEEVYLDRNW